MAITDAQKAKLNKMNRAAQDAELGKVIQDLQNVTDPEVTQLLADIAVLKSNNNIVVYDGGVNKKACPINGTTLITGGTGIADMTLAAPAANSRVVIRLASITSGSVVITTPTGVTFDGTNNTCTMNAADDWIELVYVSATAWAVVRSNSVSLSVV